MIYQKIQTKPNCEELNAVYDRIISKHNQRMKKYFNSQVVNYNRKVSSQIVKLEKQFANTIFNKFKEGTKLTIEDMQNIQPFLFIQLCSKMDSMQKNHKIQRKKSQNTQAIESYSSLQKKKQRRRDFLQKKVNNPKITLFQEKQLKELELKISKILTQRANSDSFFSINFMKLFHKKVQIVRRISIARKQSQYEQGFKCFQRASKAIEDIKASKDYVISYQLVLPFQQMINDFLKNITGLVSFLGNRLKELKEESQNTKLAKEQIFNMELIYEGLQKARVKILSSIMQFLKSCFQRVRQYYQSQFNNSIRLKQLSYLINHFESEVEYIATFVNNQLGSISRQYTSFKTYIPNIFEKINPNRPELDNKESQKLMIKIQSNFQRCCQYTSKMFEHIKEVSILHNLLAPLPYSENQISRPIFCNKRINKNKRVS